MKATKLFLAAIAAIAFASCQNESVEFANTVTADIQCNISKGLATRAFNNLWEAKDEIGLYVMKGAAPYTFYNTATKEDETVSNAQFKTVETAKTFETATFTGNYTIPFPADATAKLTFKAYYPYTTTTTDNTVEISDGVYTVKNWNQQNVAKTPIDLLVSSAVQKSASDAATGSTKVSVPLVFKHKFSKIILNISVNEAESQILPADIKEMTVTGTGMNFVTTYNILTDVTSVGTVDQGAITFKTTADGTRSEAIVCPTAIPNDNSIITFTLKKKDNEEVAKKYTWTIPAVTNKDSDVTTFLAGTSYIWNIRLYGSGLVEAELTATIENWETKNQWTGDDDYYVDLGKK